MEGEKFNNPYIDDLVGIQHEDQDTKIKISKAVQKKIEKVGARKVEGLELGKTPRDLEILNFAEQAVSNLLKRYGREKDVKISMDHVHLLPPGGTLEFTNGWSARGTQSSIGASIVLDRDPSDIQFCIVAFHEFLHLKVFTSLQIIQPESSEEKPSLKRYRSGIQVISRDGKQKFFADFEEAIVGLFTLDFYNSVIKGSVLFKDELENRRNANLPDFSRQNEIKKLNELIDDLWEENKDKFSSREEILNLFIDAQINGHLLKLGKLIEKTFGRDSLRAIGSEFRD